MTEEEAVKIHRIAKDVYEERKGLNVALDYLEKIMDRGSALMYINAFKAMKLGKCYKRAINKPATIYFLEQILVDGGTDDLKLALKALAEHTEYKVAWLKKIHAEFSDKLPK